MADEDLELVEKFQRGEVVAFDLLVCKYQKKVYDVVYHYIHDVEESYDLSQEIFGKVFKSKISFLRQKVSEKFLRNLPVAAFISPSFLSGLTA